jgi:hypothetical protein
MKGLAQRLIDSNQAALGDVRKHLDRMESAAARILAEKSQPALPAAASGYIDALLVLIAVIGRWRRFTPI